MTRTTQDLAEEVLLELGIADAANPAESSEDIAFVKRRYTNVLKELEEKGFWDENSIPDRVFDPLAQYLAYRCRKRFGVDYELDDAWRRLCEMTEVEAAPYPTRIQYF